MASAPPEGAKNASCSGYPTLPLTASASVLLVPAIALQVEEKSESENGGQQVTTVSTLACKVVCQRFRNCSPVTCDLLTACFDPVANKKLLKQILLPHRLLVCILHLCPRRILAYRWFARPHASFHHSCGNSLCAGLLQQAILFWNGDLPGQRPAVSELQTFDVR